MSGSRVGYFYHPRQVKELRDRLGVTLTLAEQKNFKLRNSLR